MNGLMMQQPLLISSLLVHAERHHGEQEWCRGGSRATSTARPTAKSQSARAAWPMRSPASASSRPARRHAGLERLPPHGAVLRGLGLGRGAAHAQPAPAPDQVVYIADHAEDQVLFFDLTFLPLVEAIAGRVKTIRHFVAMTDRAHMPAASKVANLLCYEDLVDANDDRFEWPAFDEAAASSLCYTSGTTGNPKGALYSHRSTVLHTFAIALPDALNCSARDTILPVVPMFHVNAWGCRMPPA